MLEAIHISGSLMMVYFYFYFSSINKEEMKRVKQIMNCLLIIIALAILMPCRIIIWFIK